MNKELYTVEEAAEILNLHVKTVRRFLREGRIKGRKLGRAWMIPLEGMREFAHGELAGGGPAPSREVAPGERINVSAVVEFRERESEEASRISNGFMAMLNGKDPSWGAARFDFIYYPDEGRAKYVLYGSPKFIGEMMGFFEAVADEEE